jgi:hypothetical protein
MIKNYRGVEFKVYQSDSKTWITESEKFKVESETKDRAILKGQILIDNQITIKVS